MSVLSGRNSYSNEDDLPLHLVVVDHSAHAAESLLNVMRKGGYSVRSHFVSDGTALTEILADRRWDLVLTTPQVGDLTTERVCTLVARAGQDAPVVVVGDDEDNDELPLDSLVAGAADMVIRDDDQRLLLVMKRELGHLKAARSVSRWVARAREAEMRCLALLETARDAVAYVHDGMHVYANPSYLKIFGFSDIEQLEVLPLLDLAAADDTARLKRLLREVNRARDIAPALEFRCVRSDGETVPVHVTLSPATYDGEECIQVVARDLTERDQLQTQLRHMSRRDPLTGLYNHQYLREQLVQHSQNAAWHQQPLTLLLVEVENFDAIRKTVGIALSDHIVRDLAGVIQTQVASDDTLARIGDQCFGVLTRAASIAAATELAQNIREAVAAHIWSFDVHSVATTCSVGVAPMNAYGHLPEEVMARADRAVHRALAEGGNRIEVIDAAPAEAEPETEQSTLSLATVRSALVEDQASLMFQPIVNLHGKTEEIYEVRLGLRDDDGQSISAAQAFSLADEADCASEFDLWVVNEVVAISAASLARDEPIRFFVKLSAQTIRDESTLLHITKAVRAARLPPGQLVFEIDAEVASRQVKFARAMVAVLRQVGCQSALAGFGETQTSFSVLNHVDVDYLKIAPSVVAALSESPEGQVAIRDLQTRARTLEKQTIATAVQDANTLAILWQCGVRYAQGYYIQEPNRELSYEFTQT